MNKPALIIVTRYGCSNHNEVAILLCWLRNASQDSASARACLSQSVAGASVASFYISKHSPQTTLLTFKAEFGFEPVKIFCM